MIFVTSLKNLVTTMALVVVFGVAANDAHALDFGCRDKDQISRELEAENQGTLVKFFIDGRERGAKNPEWIEVFYTADLKTGNGYRLQRSGGDKMCVSASTTNTKLFNNITLDQKAYLDAPEADKKGGVNNIIYGNSQLIGANPMLRVVEHDPYLKTTNIKFLLGNPDPKTGKGGLVASTLDGQLIEKYTKGVPSSSEALHGAEYTKYAKSLLGVTEDELDHQLVIP
ncbi:MAG TPA: hypothetical protein PL131_11155 [Methylotenera sp.]|nr:hypothetical protein [Methylotenera sp.]HPH06424.1 hypothetical protein [Methylotenera sp.]HPN00429.1 hypothetical protein [Methylotenera sp.]